MFDDVFKSKYKSEAELKKALFSNKYWFTVHSYGYDGNPVVFSRMEFQTPIIPIRAKEMKKTNIRKFLELVDASITDATVFVFVSLIRGDDFIKPIVEQYIKETYPWEFIHTTKMGDLKYSVKKGEEVKPLTL